MNITLSRYIAKNYIINTALILLGLLSLIYMFDTIELLRRASKTGSAPLNLVLQMGLLKLPEVGQKLVPFAILFSSIFTFWQLNRRSELIVLRASGFSVWKFLMPVVAIAILIACLQISIINPVGSLLISKYEQLENYYLKKQDSQIALFREGLWLRQGMDDKTGQSTQNRQRNYVILHARRIEQPGWILKNVIVFNFGPDDSLRMRLDAAQAQLEKGLWKFKDVQIHRPNTPNEQSPAFTLPTELTIKDIEDSFSSPESMSFWDLPGHIQVLKETGFDASRLQVHYHNLLSQPLLLAAMVFLAATVSMRPPRFGGTLMLLGSGIFIGFFVFFISSYLQALGYSQQIPPILAAWAPAIIFALLGLSTIISLEDS